MHRFGQVFRFELAKAVRARLTWVTLLLPLVLAVGSVWLSELARRAFATPGIEVIDSAYKGLSLGASAGLILGGILLLFYSSMTLASEGNLRLWKTIMLRPHRRIEWIGAKLLLLLLLAFAMLALVAAASLVAAAAVAPFGDIVEEGYAFMTGSQMARESLIAFALVIPPLVALTAFGLMVSTFTDHTGIAASGCIGSYVFLEALKGSFGSGRKYLFNTFMPSLVDNSYLVVLRGFADGLSDVEWPDGLILYNIATPLVWALVFSAVAAFRFGRRDFVS